jgi:hypothetical protein
VEATQTAQKTDSGPIRSTLTASVSPEREFNARKRNSVHDILIALGVGLLPTVFAFLSWLKSLENARHIAALEIHIGARMTEFLRSEKKPRAWRNKHMYGNNNNLALLKKVKSR